MQEVLWSHKCSNVPALSHIALISFFLVLLSEISPGSKSQSFVHWQTLDATKAPAYFSDTHSASKPIPGPAHKPVGAPDSNPLK